MDSHEWNELRGTSRGVVGAAWRLHLAGKPVEGEMREVVYFMERHPEWREVWDALGTDDEVEELPGPDGEPMNPLLHVMVDAAAKRQVESGDPPVAAEVYALLESNGLEELERVHVLAMALVEELWLMGKHGREFDESKYSASLRQMAKKALRRR